MDELDPTEDQRPSVKELVARIQQQEAESSIKNHESESSDDEDSPLRMTQKKGPMGDSNMALSSMPNYENVPNDLPRSRCGVYSPTMGETSAHCYVEPIVMVQETNYQPSTSRDYRSSSSPQMELSSNSPIRDTVIEQKYPPSNKNKFYHPNELYFNQKVQNNPKYCEPNIQYSDVSARFAKLRMLDNTKLFEKTKKLDSTSSVRMLDSEKMFESTTRMLENPQDVGDRDTNNDSGYSTKVYGSSKGNSPSLSGGQVEPECLGASSLV